MEGAFFVTWYKDDLERQRLACRPRTPNQQGGEWVISADQLELSRDLDIVDSQLATLRETRGKSFDHTLYAKSLISAAVTGLD